MKVVLLVLELFILLPSCFAVIPFIQSLEQKMTVHFRSKRIELTSTPQDKITITTKLEVWHIERIDEVTQTIQLHAGLELKWRDPRLAWNRTFNALAVWSAPERGRFFWTPSVHVFNGANVNGNTLQCGYDHHHSRLRVTRNGRASCQTEMSLKISCPMDFQKYPKDTHSCPIILYDGRYVARTSISYALQLSELHTGPKLTKSRQFGNNLGLQRLNESSLNGYRIVGGSAELQWFMYSQFGTEPGKNDYALHMTRNESAYNDKFEHVMAAVVYRLHITRINDELNMPMNVVLLIVVLALVVDNLQVSLAASLLAITMHALLAENMLANLPPTNEHTPRIVILHGCTLALAFASLILRMYSIVWIKSSTTEKMIETRQGIANKARVLLIIIVTLFVCGAIYFAE